MSTPLVTVYVTCRNYGHFAAQALQSLEDQLLKDFEVLFIDDASIDDSVEVANAFAARDRRFRVVANETQQGLQANANFALAAARGKYVVRLDADDWFDPCALLVMSQYLEGNPEIALVFPNYYYVDFEGKFLGLERRRQIGSDTDVLDLPAHGACTMVRRRVLKTIGGYDETYTAQDGYELWLKVASNYKVASIETPLFYYRQHATSLSTNESRILTAREAIKRAHAARVNAGPIQPRVVAIIPAKNTYEHLPNVVLEPLQGRPLLDYTIDAARASGCFEAIYVSTDDPAVEAYCREQGVMADRRPDGLSHVDRRLAEVVNDAVERLENEHEIFPDIVCVLSVHCPMRTTSDIQHAIDTLKVFSVDSVVSVYEDHDLHLAYGAAGLETLNPGAWQQLRLEREALFAFNGAITVSWRDFVSATDFHGTQISHIAMPRERSFQIKNTFDIALIKSILQQIEVGQ